MRVGVSFKVSYIMLEYFTNGGINVVVTIEGVGV